MIKEIIERARQLYDQLLYYRIADSPTMKSYTNWHEFDKYALNTDLLDKCINSESEEIDLEKIYSLQEYDVIYHRSNVVKREHIDNVEIEILSRRDLMKIDSVDRLFRLIDPLESRIYARHLAEISSTLIIRIGGRIYKPLKILISGECPQSHLSQHLLVVVEEGAEAFIQIVTDSLLNSMRTLVGEFFLEKESDLKISIVNKSIAPAFHSFHYLLSQDSSLEIYTLSIGGIASRFQNRVGLEGDYSRHHGYSLTLSSGSEWVHYVDSSMLRGVGTVSLIESRGVAMDKSKNIIQGFATQRESARKSRSNVSVSALNVGGEALTVTTPFISVETGDVEEAAHSSSQTIVDLDMLAYLRSRGFSEREVVELVLRDYIDDFLEKTPEYARDTFLRELERYIREKGFKIELVERELE
ncbi:MAG: SufD family Fe-S cluster assembly protein [Sulfolobales archaeon]